MSLKNPINSLPDLTDDSLVGSWLNSETTLGSDYSPAGNDVTTVTDVDFGEGGVGIFNGTSSDLTRTNTLMSQGAWTVSVWLNLASSPAINTNIIYGDSAGGQNNPVCRYIGLRSTGELALYDADGSAWRTGNTVLAVNQWYKADYVYDGNGTVTFYLNGIADGTGAIGANKDFLYLRNIGNQSGSARWFDGSIKMLNIYSEAKSASWVANQYALGVPDDSLVLHVEDGTEDLSRYKHTLMNYDATLGKMEFDGAGYILVSQDSVLEPASAVTVMAWVKTTSVAAGVYRVIDNTKNSKGYTIYRDGSSLTVAIGNGSAYNTDTHPTSLIVSQWIHVGLTCDGTTLYSYFNGVRGSGTASSGINTASGENVLIGIVRGIGGQQWNGQMDDIKIFNEAKSADYIKQYYEMTKGLY